MRNYGNQTVLYQSFSKQLPMVCPGDGAVEETQTQSVLVGSTVNSLLVGDRALVLIWLKFFYYGVKKSVWEKNEHVKIYYESVFFFLTTNRLVASQRVQEPRMGNSPHITGNV